MSFPEVLLWQQLRKRPGGFLFRRQHPQHPYVLDFACLSARLAIEVDGEHHARGQQPASDGVRDSIMSDRGFRTLRIPARDILSNLDGCLFAIVAACAERSAPPPPLRGGPPPRAGEEL